jgi:hypothetical protein
LGRFFATTAYAAILFAERNDDKRHKFTLLGFPNPATAGLRTRFHRVVLSDRGTACPCLLPAMAVKFKPPAVRVVVDSVIPEKLTISGFKIPDQVQGSRCSGITYLLLIH